MKGSVLLIEDNEHNRYLATFLLENHGYTVTHANDGLKGIELSKTMRPDVVLLDIQLPTMDGYAVASALSEIFPGKNVPIIAVTSYAMVGDKEKALAAGCTGYIEKPIDPENFIKDIERIISSFRLGWKII